MRVRILGSGTSSGVPRIGNDWGACDPAEPRNRRSRASILIESETTRILVDTSPDMREQLLAAGVADVDAVIWTHDHADHTHGTDDLTVFVASNFGDLDVLGMNFLSRLKSWRVEGNVLILEPQPAPRPNTI